MILIFELLDSDPLSVGILVDVDSVGILEVDITCSMWPK